MTHPESPLGKLDSLLRETKSAMLKETGYELDGIADKLNQILNFATNNDDTANAIKWRRVSAKVKRALKDVEAATAVCGVEPRRSPIYSPIDPRKPKQ